MMPRSILVRLHLRKVSYENHENMIDCPKKEDSGTHAALSWRSDVFSEIEAVSLRTSRLRRHQTCRRGRCIQLT